MPNGVDKNFVRLCGAIDGFRSRYGRWPTEARVGPHVIEEFRKLLFSEEAYRTLEQKLTLTPTSGALEVVDEEGGRYSYAEDGFPDEGPDIPALMWLGVRPDRDAG